MVKKLILEVILVKEEDVIEIRDKSKQLSYN